MIIISNKGDVALSNLGKIILALFALLLLLFILGVINGEIGSNTDRVGEVVKGFGS